MGNYKFLMAYCIHCHHEFSNHEYAGLYAKYWEVECPSCGEVQTREEFRKAHDDATGEDLGCPDALL